MKGLHQQLFLVITAIFLAYMGVFFYYQYTQDLTYKEQLAGVRVTIIDTLGNVVMDTEEQPHSLANHKARPEVQDALKNGYGYDIRRTSETNGETYFYSATYSPETNQIVRSALPYPSEENKVSEHTYRALMIALLVFVFLTIVLYWYTRIVSKRVDSTIEEYKNQVRQAEEEKNRIKHELTQNTAHELKTPAASINGYLETLIANPDIPAQQRQHFLERTYAQAQRMTQLLQDMSILTRLDALESHLIDVALAPVDVIGLIEQVEDDLWSLLEKEHISVEKHLPDTLVVQADSKMLYYVFRNIIDNAIAYSGASLITISYDRAKQCFTIADNGVGVPEEHLSHLFERFYRVDKSRSRNAQGIGGTGLGLAIAKNVVLTHGGTIQAANTQPHGLTISFTLPTK